MTSAYLPSLEPATQRREKIRKRVRQTSVAAYVDGRERFTGRKANVLRWLAAFYNYRQEWPTSAELWSWAEAETPDLWQDETAAVLYIRRGISDLQPACVEANGARVCWVSGRRCETWRVIPAGR